MTGVVNLVFWTLYENKFNSFYYTFVYLYGVAAITSVFKAYKIRIKI